MMLVEALADRAAAPCDTVVLRFETRCKSRLSCFPT